MQDRRSATISETTSTAYLHRLAAAGGVLLMAFALLFGWQSWRTTKAEQITQLETVLELTESAVDRYFSEVRASLGGLASVLHSGSTLVELPLAQRHLRGYHDRRPELTGVALFDLEGRSLASSTTTRLTGLPDAPRMRAPDFRRPFTSGGDVLQLSAPLRGALTNRWILPMDFAVRGVDGTPIAYIVAGAPVELLQAFWSDAPIFSRAVIGLMRDDGYLISRYPIPAEARMFDVYGKPRTGAAARHIMANGFPRRGYVEGISLMGGTQVGGVFKRLEHFPATLIVTMPQAEFRAAWWRAVQVPFALTAILAVAGYLVYRHTLARQLEWSARQALIADELERRVVERTAQLHALGAQLEAAEGRERRQIARDLHDDLGQTLSAARIRLTALEADERAGVRKAAAEVGALIERANASTRTLAAQLAPPVLYELGLVPALEWLAEEIERDFDLRVELHDDGEVKPLSQEARSILYRAARELLINVAKHAATDSARVYCERRGDRLFLRVEDGGVGIENTRSEGEVTRGTGLATVRERLSFIGGGVSLRGAPAGGTEVELDAPLTGAGAAAQETDA